MFSLKVDEDIELRSVVEKDAEEILEIVKRNYEHLHPFLHWVTEDYSPKTLAGHSAFIITKKSSA
jgi:hypothetical protein